MRFTMGRYINSLDVEGLDRLIGAPEFNDGRWWFSKGCGCLVGTALGFTSTDDAPDTLSEALDLVGAWRSGAWSQYGPAWRYPAAVLRFGKDRVVRAIKARAAKLNGSSAESIRDLTENRAGRVGVGGV